MQGYGQAPIQNQQLAELLAQQQMTQQRQQAAQGLMDNNGHAGLAGILGAALGGWQNKKKGDMLAQGNSEIEQQIAAMQAESEAQIKAAKEAQEAKKWAREDMIRAEKAKQAQDTMLAQQAFQAEQAGLGREDVNNRFSQSQGMANKQFDATQAYRQAQLEAQQNKGTKQGLFTPEEQALIEQKPHLAQEIMQRKEDKATGTDTKAKNKEIELKRKLSGSVNELFSQLMNEGTETWGSDSKKMKTTYTDLLLQAKEAYNLGVLSGPDLELMENVINNPTSMASGMNPWAGGNIRGQLKEFAKRFELQDPEEAYKALSEEPEAPEIVQQNKMLFKYSRNK